MTELLENLEEQRNKLNKKAEKHRRERDKLNDVARKWADKRDKLNAESRKLIEDANEHRKKRDKLNENVKDMKKVRDECNKKVNEIQFKLSKLKKKHLPKDGVTLEKLRKEVKALEFKQMTSVLSPEKERGLIDLLSEIQGKIDEREKMLEGNKEVQNTIKEKNKAKEEAEKAHKKVSEMAEKAQKEHELMYSLYDRGDALRSDADDSQKEFIKAKLAADEEHKGHVELLKQIHDFDKIIAGLKHKKAKSKKEKVVSTVKKEAEEIYEKFKAGEKLSTEDLMSLQKAGYI